MQPKLAFEPSLTAEELRGFSRTVAEIEWLLLILVLLYQLVLAPDEVISAALAMAMFFFAAFVLSFHYANFHRKESHRKLLVETVVMIVFITWVLLYTGGASSPLNHLYLLVIIVSALTLGKLTTLVLMGVIVACYVWLDYPQRNILSLPFGTALVAQIAPMLLVAYITTMLSADIRRAYGHMKLLSETDELTGVLNMRAFGAIGDRIYRQAERYARPFSVLMIDSDHLKSVNDTLGHDAGNRLLKLTVQCIQSQLRQTDVVARFGGDEFVVVLPDTTANGAVGVAERIRKSIESSPLTARDKKVSTTVSIGIAGYPTQGHDLDTVLERADNAMYTSKSGGKNRITLFAA